MDRLIKTILIISIAVFGAGILFVDAAQAQPIDNLVVEYWSETENNWLPLQGSIFDETNFLPGQSVTRLVRVTNNSGATQRIATEAINENDPDDFGEKLSLIIKEGPTVIFNNTLTQFFDQGETYLSDLANNANTQYDFTVGFNPDAGDFYQGKTLGFDIIVGFEGTEGGLSLPSPGEGTGGGGDLPPGLIISNEAVAAVTEVPPSGATAIITWQTNYAATSQVIYGLNSGGPYSLDLSAPHFGYPNSTTEDPTKVINHSVVITGLILGETYRYRVISHASPATISYEHTFVAAVDGEVLTPTDAIKEGSNASLGGGLAQEGGSQGTEESDENREEIAGAGNDEKTADISAAQETGGNRNFAAAFFAISKEGIGWFWWILLLVLIILIIIFVRRRRKNQK